MWHRAIQLKITSPFGFRHSSMRRTDVDEIRSPSKRITQGFKRGFQKAKNLISPNKRPQTDAAGSGIQVKLLTAL